MKRTEGEALSGNPRAQKPRLTILGKVTMSQTHSKFNLPIYMRRRLNQCNTKKGKLVLSKCPQAIIIPTSQITKTLGMT